MNDELRDRQADERDKKRHKKTKGMVIDNKGLRDRLIAEAQKRKEQKNG